MNRTTRSELSLTKDGQGVSFTRGETRAILPEPGRHPETGFFPEGYAYQAFGIDGHEKGDGAKVEVVGRTPLQLIESTETPDKEVRVCEIRAKGDATLFIFNTRDPHGDIEEYSPTLEGDDMSVMYELHPGELMCWMATPGQENNPAEVIEYTEPKFSQLKYTDLNIALPPNYTKDDLKIAIRIVGQTLRSMSQK